MARRHHGKSHAVAVLTSELGGRLAVLAEHEAVAVRVMEDRDEGDGLLDHLGRLELTPRALRPSKSLRQSVVSMMHAPGMRPGAGCAFPCVPGQRIT